MGCGDFHGGGGFEDEEGDGELEGVVIKTKDRRGYMEMMRVWYLPRALVPRTIMVVVSEMEPDGEEDIEEEDDTYHGQEMADWPVEEVMAVVYVKHC